MSRPGTHRSKAVGRGASEKVEEYGLGLVVGRVTGGDGRGQGREPGETRPGLQVRAWDNRHFVHDNLDAERASRLVNDLDVELGAVAKTVIDVMGDRRTIGGHSQGEEGQRIRAPGHGAVNGLTRLGKRAAADQRGSGL